MSQEFDKLELGPRNDPIGFAQRSYMNLRIIEKSLEKTGEGHVVTQLVQSLLSYIVFPKERRFYDYIKHISLDEIYGAERPFVQMIGKTNNLNQLLRHLRNAVGHGLVVFHGSGPHGSDSRKLEEIFIEFGDREDPNGPLDWQILIEGVHLRTFMFNMIERAKG
jgi:hypothetical protein